MGAVRLGSPTYVITGRFRDDPVVTGHDDQATAELIDGIRRGSDVDITRGYDCTR